MHLRKKVIISQQPRYNELMKEKPTSIRVFFGIPIADSLIYPYKEQLLKAYPQLKHQVRWTLEGNHHVTIRFLGNIEEAKVSKLIELTHQATNEAEPFDMQLRYICPFPVRHGALSAITIEASPKLQSLHDTVNIAARHLDFKDENRAYLPHITLFRSKTKLQTDFQKIELNNASIRAQEMVLYQSIPTEKGSIYKIIHRFPFNPQGENFDHLK